MDYTNRLSEEKRAESCFGGSPQTPQIVRVHSIDTGKFGWWSFPLHKHRSCVELTLVRSGKGIFHRDEQEWQVKRGDLKIKVPGTLYSEYTDEKNPLSQITILVSGSEVLSFFREYMHREDLSPVLSVGEEFPFLEQLFCYVQRVFEGESACRGELLGQLTGVLFAMLHEKLPGLRGSEKLYTVTEQKVREAARYLTEHYFENPTLDELASLFDISAYYLSRKFHELTGFTINQYIVHLKIGEAERLLIYEDLPIKEIAGRCGYPNLQYFYATFKKHAGCTPLELKERYL